MLPSNRRSVGGEDGKRSSTCLGKQQRTGDGRGNESILQFFFKHRVLWRLIASYIVLRHLFNSKFNFLPPSVLTDLQNNRVHQLTDADEGAGAHRVQGTLQHTFGGRGRRRGKGPVSRSLQGQRRRRIQKRSRCFSFIGSEHGQWQQGPLISAVLNT